MNLFQYQDFLDELGEGRSWGVFVDDTGSPGLPSTPANIHPKRKTWVAVVVRPDIMPEVLDQLSRAIDELQRTTGASEFHFADIYAGRREFKHVHLQVRLALFHFMADLFVA
jgi:hypothetical protein